MSILVLLNDVETDLDEAKLVIGDSDVPDNLVGKTQAEIISSYLYTKVRVVDRLYCSPAIRIRKLVHRIRLGSKDQSLTRGNTRRVDELKERSFGVLSGTQLCLDGDLFSMTRISADNGESIFQCRNRVIKYINQVCENCLNKTILLVSHPFLCQIAMNAILQKDHTAVTSFWMKKGSFVQFVFEPGTYGIKWGFHSGYNAIIDTSYTQDEIYSELLGKPRTYS